MVLRNPFKNKHKKYEYYIQNFETIINDETTITPYITKMALFNLH